MSAQRRGEDIQNPVSSSKALKPERNVRRVGAIRLAFGRIMEKKGGIRAGESTDVPKLEVRKVKGRTHQRGRHSRKATGKNAS